MSHIKMKMYFCDFTSHHERWSETILKCRRNRKKEFYYYFSNNFPKNNKTLHNSYKNRVSQKEPLIYLKQNASHRIKTHQSTVYRASVVDPDLHFC